ncbi:hydroxymethylglutaryl-CoA lyase [Caenimonas aquaedulcis]|uniref:Hydroxymethylglutaryl-CoA lyase n=1 Tax=Caenimonas aquaedulcis TaxID=2793270 RepID=A0A931H0R5_9BURK|nr:hydroxymethylglutaryl-CoA lyase [Caenimonas aquaedulcis]MBG9386436.1 hydroxymethylglutaryl-CoA lyase [Caenimonas aquaedulcis]
MSDLPKAVSIKEEGPREGFQFEKGPIPTARKIELIDSLSKTGLKEIQVVSFVPGKNVPGMADADEVVAGLHAEPGVSYRGMWLNEKGLMRALASTKLEIQAGLVLTASETFLRRNQNRTLEENLEGVRRMADVYVEHQVPVHRVSIAAAFGCNFEGDIPREKVLGMIAQLFDIARERGLDVGTIFLADTMAWATPVTIKRMVGDVRDRWPDKTVALHLHDTRGMGIANAMAGLEMGVAHFDSAVGGLGGCPFASHKGAAGNVCTEDFVFLCEELGIETGVDLEALLESARLAEDIVGHPLPGSVKTGGALSTLRRRLQRA